MRVVLIDDSKSVLFALQAALGDLTELTIDTFLDPEMALLFCKSTVFDVVVVDYTMPKLNGIEVIRALRRQPSYSHVPIIMITSETERSIRLEAIEAGATEFLSKPIDVVELKARVRNLLALRQAQLELSARANGLTAIVANATLKIVAREEEIIWRLARAIEYRDGNTGEHVSRVAHICRLLAEDLGLDDTLCRMIYLAAPLHDVGKIGIADDILLKPGRLTSEELEQMRRHVEIGVSILENGSSDLVRIAETIAGGHHERWDGTGYPNQLSGEQIPIEARIAAVADVFEALCSERTYKQAWPVEQAYQHIIANSGQHFDPRCVDAFKRQWPTIAALMEVKPGAEPPGLSLPPAENRSARQSHLAPKRA